MTPPIATQKYTVTAALILSMLAGHGLHAGEQEKQTVTMHITAFIYNTEATTALRQIYTQVNNENYAQQRPKLETCVKKDANPNVACFSIPLLHRALMQNDYAFTELLLARKADPNACGYGKPLSRAETPQMAQLLIDNKANPHAQEHLGNVLHDAARNEKSADLVAFFCNAGVDRNLINGVDNSPLDTLLLVADEKNAKNRAEIAAIFLWTGSRPHKRSFEILGKTAPGWIPHMQALMTVVPQVKREQEYQQSGGPLLEEYITKEPAHLVAEYMDPAPLSWHKSYWPDIQQRVVQKVGQDIAQKFEVVKKAVKRPLAKSLTKSRKR